MAARRVAGYLQDMGRLQRLEDGMVRYLTASQQIGRDHSVFGSFERAVSGSHLSIKWNGEMWVAKDLNSRNGTWVDGNKLRTEVFPLRQGSTIGLGRRTPSLVLVDDGPPCPFVTNLQSGAQHGEEDAEISLPEATLFRDLALDRWVADVAGDHRPLVDGMFGDWLLTVPAQHDGTVPVGVLSLDFARLVFEVSQNLEFVHLRLDDLDTEIDAGTRQTYWPLLLLAHQRTVERGLPEHAQGWIDLDTLCHEAGLTRRTLDVYVSRARKVLEGLGVTEAGRLVEARPGQRRLGIEAERIVGVPSLLNERRK